MAHSDDIDTIEAESLLWHSEKVGNRNRYCFRTRDILLTFSLALNAALIATVVWHQGFTILRSSGSYQAGFNTDLASARPQIEVIRHKFTGGIILDHKNKYHVDHEDQGSVYVGQPSRKIDDAWHRLLEGLNMDVEASEAKDLGSRTYKWPENGKYFTGLDVHHSLHCLNRLRQALYPDHYDVFNDPNDPAKEMHIGHCINHIRQSIQCHADLTPMEWVELNGKVILRTDTIHTCRNFDRISNWARERRTNFNELQSVLNGSLFVVD